MRKGREGNHLRTSSQRNHGDHHDHRRLLSRLSAFKLWVVALLLGPGLLGAQPKAEPDSLGTGTVTVKHHPQRLVKLGRELTGAWGREQRESGSSRWNDFEIFWGYPLPKNEEKNEGTIFSGLRPGIFSLWVLDSAYRLMHTSFTLQKGETRHVDALAGATWIGKKALATVVDNRTKAPIVGALAHFECTVPQTKGEIKLSLQSGAVTSDSLGRIEMPPCLNAQDMVFIQYRVTDNSQP
jgi:hypothetical protein